MNILVVDSEKSILEQLRDSLASAGHRVSTASDAAQALDEALRSAPDLVIANLLMQGTDGVPFWRGLKHHTRLGSIPLLLYTDAFDDEVERKLPADIGGCRIVVRRPAQPAAFLQAISKSVAQLDASGRMPSEEDAGKTLRDIRLLYQTLVNTGQVLMWTAGPDGRCNFFNAAWLAFTGRKLDQEVGFGWTENVHPDDLRHCLDTYNTAVDRREPFSATYRLRHHDGQYRYVQDDGAPHYDDDGNFLGYVGHALDVTERIHAQQELQRSEQRLRATLENTPHVAVQWYDEAGRILYWNQASEEMYGWKAQEALGKTLDQLIWTPEQAADFLRALKEIQKTRTPQVPIEAGFLRRDGTAGWIRSSLFPIPAGEGRTWFVCMDVEITEQKRSAEALKTSEARFRVLAEHSVVGIYVIIGDRFKYANPTLAGIFGYTQDEMLAVVRPIDLVADPDRERVAESIRLRIRGSITTTHHTWQGIRKDGQLIVVESYGTRVDWEGQPAVMGTILDITERAQAHDRIARAAREWEMTFHSTNDAIWILDKDQRVLRANKKTETVLDVPCAALVGRHCYEVVHGSNSPCSDCVYAKCLKSGQRESTEMQIENSWFEVIADPIRDDAGQIVGAVHIMSNITERKRIENEIRESEERYRMLVEESPDGIGIFQDGQLIFVNSSGAKNLGYNSRQDMYGLRTAQLIHPDDLPAAMDRLKRRLAGDTGLYPAEVRYLRQDGTIVPVEVVASPIVYGGKPAVQFIARDITERKRAEAERDKLQDQLLQSQKMESVGRLAGGVAHDFNNMLQAIFGYVSLAIEDVPPGSSTHQYMLQIQQAATRAAGLTRQLVAFARKQAIRPVVLDLNATVDSTLTMLKSLIGEDIELEWLPGRDLWHVNVDPTQLDQVLANLTVNARDAIKATGKLTIETRNAVLDEAYAAACPECMPGRYVMLAVSDTGCGMDKEALSHVFEPFYTTKEPGKGSGLGLATVFGIVKQNKGIINVYSEPGQGTTFKIYLPRAECEPAPPSHEPKRNPPHGNETVLLVEDEPQILNVGKRVLEGLGYKVFSAPTPAAALDVVAQCKEQIHLLVTDVVLPGMNGKDLQKRLAATHPQMKCIFMSGYTADAIVKHGVLEEGIAFLQKPFNFDDLALKIREVLDRQPSS